MRKTFLLSCSIAMQNSVVLCHVRGAHGPVQGPQNLSAMVSSPGIAGACPTYMGYMSNLLAVGRTVWYKNSWPAGAPLPPLYVWRSWKIVNSISFTIVWSLSKIWSLRVKIIWAYVGVPPIWEEFQMQCFIQCEKWPFCNFIVDLFWGNSSRIPWACCILMSITYPTTQCVEEIWSSRHCRAINSTNETFLAGTTKLLWCNRIGAEMLQCDRQPKKNFHGQRWWLCWLLLLLLFLPSVSSIPRGLEKN